MFVVFKRLSIFNNFESPLLVLYTDEFWAFVVVTSWHCMTRPWNVSWIWSYTLAGSMLLTVTIDRLIAVFMPIRYLRLTSKDMFRMCALTYVSCMFLGAFAALDTYFYSQKHQVADKQALCATKMAVTTAYKHVLFKSWIYPPLMSVIFYIPVLLKLAIKVRVEMWKVFRTNF